MTDNLEKREGHVDSENQSKDRVLIPNSKSVLKCPSSISNVELARKIKVGDTWAYYDAKCNLPTSYVVIEECTQPLLLVTRLKPIPAFQWEKEWTAAGLPVSCGRFEYGETSLESPAFLSHPTLSSGDPPIIIPFEGETWAVYKDWDLFRWTSHPGMHRTCEYEYVEVLPFPCDVCSPLGVRVAYLDKVVASTSSFKRRSLNKDDSFLIPVNSLYRFSHRVPSVSKTSYDPNMNVDCIFEFDVRALPLSFFIDRKAWLLESAEAC